MTDVIDHGPAVTESEPASSPYAEFDELESDYSVPTEPFDLLLESGKKVRARALADATAILGVEKYVKVVQQSAKRLPDPNIKALGHIDPDTLRMCVYLETFVLQPKRTWYEWYRLSKSTGMLIPEIFNKLDAKLREDEFAAFESEVDEAKNA